MKNLYWLLLAGLVSTGALADNPFQGTSRGYGYCDYADALRTGGGMCDIAKGRANTQAEGGLSQIVKVKCGQNVDYHHVCDWNFSYVTRWTLTWCSADATLAFICVCPATPTQQNSTIIQGSALPSFEADHRSSELDFQN